MSKKNQNPISVPPVEEANLAAMAQDAPEIQASEFSSGSTDSESAPSLSPPTESSASGDEGFGAGVWNNSKKVNALYSTDGSKNSWMGITGTGWVKLNTKSDTGNMALTILASVAKLKNSNINYLLDASEAKEIYVW